MCGIGGILRTDGKPIPEEWLDAIDARIAWRGPDGHGRFRDRVEFIDERGEQRTVEVAFVHRRLSIIDHAGGHQPMVSERGRSEREGLVAVVFNGCIYNHRELRKELEAKGHRFVSDHSDTEVLIHGWREWGESMVDRLEAMYAMALWDRRTASLFLARDWFGEKPLYFRNWPDPPDAPEDPAQGVIFASDAKSLEHLPFFSEIADQRTQLHWTAQYLQLGYTDRYVQPYQGDGTLWVLEAGSFLREGPRLARRRSFRELPQIRAEHAADAVSRLEELLATAVARRLEADVPLGCFLSGGVDSSLVATFAHRYAEGITTFTVRMPDRRYDESAHASAVAHHLGTQHRVLDASPHPAADLIHLIEQLGQPFGDSSILPTYWVSKAARTEMKVALSGDGGDELFVGYDRYLIANRLPRHFRWLRHLPVSVFERLHPKSTLHRIARLRRVADDFATMQLASLEAIFSVQEIESLTGEEWIEHIAIPDSSTPLATLRRHDIEQYLPGDLLRKVDTASMACGLEVRCPFLDRDLARAALSMPIDQLMPGGQRKGLLRRIARKYLPREIVDRPKMGFAIPIGEWFRSDYGGMKTLLLDYLNSVEPFGSMSLSRKAVNRFIDEHMSGKRDHGQRLFSLLTLSIWAKSQQVNKSTSQK